MRNLQKYLYTCLIATSALLSAASFQAALAQSTAPPLSTGLQSFAVLSGGVAGVTCTDSVVVGNVGGSFAAASPTRCTFTGGIPPATNGALPGALSDFRSAYTALKAMSCPIGNNLDAAITGLKTLEPGVYCTGVTALTGTTVELTLDAKGDANAVWIFQIGAALTGTSFNVTMANGGQACNVFWVPSADVTMTTSAFKGNILAGLGSITLTGSPVDGRALANVAVTMTNSVIGCGGLGALADALSCKPGKRLVCKSTHRHHGGKDDDDDDDDGGGDKNKNKNDKEKSLPTNSWWKHFFN